jgi:hypothetical protein
MTLLRECRYEWGIDQYSHDRFVRYLGVLCDDHEDVLVIGELTCLRSPPRNFVEGDGGAHVCMRFFYTCLHVGATG